MVCHEWPGITPFNVWDLKIAEWLLFAEAADLIVRQRREQARG